MRISVVIPVHNEERYLRYSLPSLKCLDVDEFVFVLDRCTDHSFDLIIRAMKRATIIIKKKKRWRNGCAEAFQMGFDEAKGDVIRKLLKESIGVDIRRLKGLTVIADACHLPFRNETFDLTLCFEMLEHIKEYNRALAELCRVTKETILITTPHKIAVFYRMLHPRREYPHEHYLSLKDLQIPHDWMLLWKRSVWYQQICLRRK